MNNGTRITGMEVTALAVVVRYDGCVPLLATVTEALQTAGVTGGVRHSWTRSERGTMVLLRTA